MELPEPDPGKLLQAWMEWERGEVTPGRVMANLKTAGMRQLLESLAERNQLNATQEPSETEGGSEPASWSPVV